MAGIERSRELRRRRTRKKKVQVWRRRVASASAAEKAEIARKLRRLTPGADALIESLGIRDQ